MRKGISSLSENIKERIETLKTSEFEVFLFLCSPPLTTNGSGGEQRNGNFQWSISSRIIPSNNYHLHFNKKQKWLSRLLLNNLMPQAVSHSVQTTRRGWLYPRSMKIHVHSKLKYLSNYRYLVSIKMDNLIFQS